LAVALAVGNGCKRDSAELEGPSTVDETSHDDDAHKDHAHDGHEHHEGDGHDHGEHREDEDHGHCAEIDLGTVTIGDMKVACAQGHGKVEAGKEGHLVVKLLYNDKGATIVRAWIGTSDRTLSLVGKGEYAAAHDDYDIHAIAPDPLPENVMWWIEVEKPDGKRADGSVKPMLD
jgi:ABC-type Zn2+ transport system substrate-binding protein/surface adhesin